MDDHAGLNPPEPGYRHILRVHLLLLWLPLLIGAVILDRTLLDDSWAAWLAPIAIGVVAALAVIIAPGRIYRRLGWQVEADQLQAVRGWLIHVDTIVPFVRVQHIDVSRGPLDKMFGTATLVVHTAGTHNNVVTVPGLSPDRADELRASIRASIRSDLE